MKKHAKREHTSFPPTAGPDIAILMAKMQQQLIILDKKMDSLISQSSERFFKREHYSKPFQRFDRFARQEKRDHGDSYRERRFTQAICADCHKECEVPFKPSGDRPVYCKDCFSRRKQGGPFKGEYDKGSGREGDTVPIDYSDMKQGRKNRRHARRKSTTRRRKERA